MTVTIGGVTYPDGIYSGLCSREKAKRTFYGVVTLTDTGRVLAIGPCDGTGGEGTASCGTSITKVLYAP
jgi:hypothetical protein